MRNIILTSMVNNYTHFKSFLRGKNLLRRILLIALVISSNCDAKAADFSSEYKGVTLRYEILDNGTLYVKGADNSEITDLEIPGSVTYDGKAYSVTEIGNSAFYNHSSLTAVSLPNSITTINYSAFARCEFLTSINLSESLVEIGDGAFHDCTSLVSISIPNGVEKIEYNTFLNCSSLSNVSLPETLIAIEYEAFKNCTSLTSLSLPNGLVSIDGEAFSGCSSLKSITLPESLTSIGEYAFSGCTQLNSLTLPESLTSIGDFAFYDCKSLGSLTLPKSLNTFNRSICTYSKDEKSYGHIPVKLSDNNPYMKIVDGNIYNNDGSILLCVLNEKSIAKIPESVKEIGPWSFCRSGVTAVSIPSTVNKVGVGAFYNCLSLKSISFPNSITGIPGWICTYCDNLTDVSLPTSFTYIGEFAFCGCFSMSSISFPSSLTFIGDYAFWHCSLTSVYCNAVVPPTTKYSFHYDGVGPGFDQYEYCTVYVPANSVEDYKNIVPDYGSDWNLFKNIVAMDLSEVEKSMADGRVSVAVRDGNIVVNGAGEVLVEVYGLNGRIVYRGTEGTVEGLPHGVYIVRVGGHATKVIL